MTRASDTAKLLGAGATILDGTTISTADNTDSLTLTSTDADANAGPNLRMYRNSGSPADADILGVIDFEGRNDNSQDVIYVNLLTQTADVSDGTEDGSFYMQTMVGGSLIDRVTLVPTETVLNEGSADIDFRVESNGDANCLFIDGGNNVVGINNNVMSSMSTDSNNLVVGSGSGNEGITIFSATNGTSNIYLADGSSGATRYRGWLEYAHSSDYLTFGVAGAERIRIDNGGSFYVGTSSTSPNPGAIITASGSLGLGRNNSNNGNSFIEFRRNATQIGSVTQSGTDGVAYNTSSDYRLKENVSYSFDATTRLKQLKPARFNFIADADKTVDGFLAHEVSSIVPEAITGTKDATKDVTNVVLNADGSVKNQEITQEDWEEGKLSTTDEDGNTVDPIYASDTTWVASKTMPDYQGIDQSKLVPLLVKTIQELEARITALES